MIVVGFEVLLEVLIRCEVVPVSRCCRTMSEAWEMPPPAPSSTRMAFAPLPAMTLLVDWKMKRSAAAPSR